MGLHDIPLKEIDEKRIQAQVGAKVPEDRHTEYKRTVPLGKDEDKREFLYDVSSFANGDGGDIIVGIEAEKGIPKAVHPIPDGETDALMLKMEDMARAAIQPRLPSFHLVQVQVPGGKILVLRIGRSWLGPHRVTHNGANRFYVRTGTGKHEMDVQELRNAFARTGNTRERLMEWRRHRLEEIRDHRDEPAPSVPFPRAVVHLVPLSAVDGGIQVDLLPFDSLWPRILTLRGAPQGNRWNFDGMAVMIRETDKEAAWTQVYRDGRFEAVGDATYADTKNPGNRLLRSALTKGIHECVLAWMKLYAEFEIQGPFVLMVSLLDVRGVHPKEEPWGFEGKPIDRRDLLFPDDILESAQDVEKAIAAINERLANAVGRPTN